jgi:hypothetical protein
MIRLDFVSAGVAGMADAAAAVNPARPARVIVARRRP